MFEHLCRCDRCGAMIRQGQAVREHELWCGRGGGLSLQERHDKMSLQERHDEIGHALSRANDIIGRLEAELEELRATNSELSEHLQDKWGRDPYLGHIQTENSRLRAFVDFIRGLATNPTDGARTRCAEIVVACNRSLHRDAWPPKGE